MPLIRQSAIVALAALSIGLVSAASPTRTRDASHDSAQIARIHAHFDSVLSELESRDVAGLDSGQRAHRTAMIGALRAYDAHGRFPNNYDFPAQSTPYFLDRETGARCAVAHLLESTGRHDIVQRIARTNNNVRAGQLAGDTAFTDWLREHGITLAEAARIQPSYEGDRRSNGVSTGTVVAVVGGSLLAVSSAVGTTIWNSTGNADGHNRFGNVLGVVSGVLTTVVGASVAGSAEGAGARAGGVATAGVGVLSVALGLRGSARRAPAVGTNPETARVETTGGGARQASLVPIVVPGRNASAGVSLHFRF